MVKRLLLSIMITVLGFMAWPQESAAQGGGYVVQPGDTLFRIATRYGVSASELAVTNGLTANAWVYAGQRLTVPGRGVAATSGARTFSGGSTHVVGPGETLSSIATRYGTTISAIQTANNLPNSNFIYSGQRLIIPGGSGGTPTVAPTISIDVNLTTQTITAYEGQTPVYTALASTGTWKYPTVVGTFEIYVKYRAARMYGGYGEDAYDLSNVPYVMYFHQGYGLHGTYWHSNFGTPMSRGCVNLSTNDAGWFFDWASVGTKVVTHY